MSFPKKAEQLNAFLRQLEGSSDNVAAMADIITKSSDDLVQARKAIEKSELSNFLSKNNPDDLLTTQSPYAAFESIFQQKKEGPGMIGELMKRAGDLDPARKQLVVNGMRTAYMRFLRDKTISVAQGSAGSNSPKVGALIGTKAEVNSYLDMGRRIFNDAPTTTGAPGYMDQLAALMKLTGAISQEKGSVPIPGVSATAFLQEAKTATGRLINLTLGPLNRMGTQFRSLTGMLLEGKMPAQKAQLILDNFFSDGNYVISLSKRFDANPMDADLKSQMIAALYSTSPKVRAAEVGGGEVKQQMSDLGLE